MSNSMKDSTQNRSAEDSHRGPGADISNMKSFIERGELPDSMQGAIRRASRVAPIMGETYAHSHRSDKSFRSVQFGTTEQTDNQTLKAMIDLAKAALDEMKSRKRFSDQIRVIYETEGKEAATDALFRITQTKGTSIVHSYLN